MYWFKKLKPTVLSNCFCVKRLCTVYVTSAVSSLLSHLSLLLHLSPTHFLPPLNSKPSPLSLSKSRALLSSPQQALVGFFALLLLGILEVQAICEEVEFCEARVLQSLLLQPSFWYLVEVGASNILMYFVFQVLGLSYLLSNFYKFPLVI